MAQLIVDSEGTVKDVREARNPMFPDKKQRTLDFDRVTNYLQEGRELLKDFEIGQREATFLPQPEHPELPIVIALMSDIHYGSVGANYELLRRHLDIIEHTPNMFLATNGDEVDNFNAVFHATGMTENPLPPQIQSRAIAGELLRLDRMGKVAVFSQGNHNRAGFLGGQDWYDSFLGSMQAPVFTSGGILNIGYDQQLYRMVINHTYWGRSKLNVTNAAKRLMEYEAGGDADIAWVGHTHQSSYEHLERGRKDILAIVSGTYKVDDPWAAQNGIGGRGQQPGICVMLWGNQRRMQAFKDIEVAQEFMNSMVRGE